MKVQPGRSIRKFVSTALGSVALMAAVALPGQSAFALGTTTNLGTVGSPYSNGIGDNLLGDFDESFLDVYRFTLSPASPPSLFNAINITVDLESKSFSLDPGSFTTQRRHGPHHRQDRRRFSLDPGSFTTQLYDVSTATIVYTASGMPFSIGPFTGSFNLIAPLPIASGDSFELRVSGLIAGEDGGFYRGTFSISPAPVPEAETYAMLLAGLGLMGFVVRRRKQSQDAAAARSGAAGISRTPLGWRDFFALWIVSKVVN